MRFLSHLLALVAALAIAHPVAYASHETAKTAETASVQVAQSDDEDGWACWAQGNRMCSTVPLGHRGDLPTRPLEVLPLCVTDAQCEAFGLTGGVMRT